MKIDEVIESGKDTFKTFLLTNEELAFLAKDTYPLSYIKYIKNEDWYALTLKQLPELKAIKKQKNSDKLNTYQIIKDISANILKVIDSTQIQTKINGT